MIRVLSVGTADRNGRVLPLMATVLIADDSPTIRRMVRASLESIRGLTFNEAGTGLEAIETLVVRPADLIVLDLNMPDMHGLDVLKFVRSQPSFKTLPVVVLTTRADEVSRRAALAAGATMFLTKPFSPAALARDVRTLLGVPGAASTSTPREERS
jgi:two-component system chemotaxis response regulator CheY